MRLISATMRPREGDYRACAAMIEHDGVCHPVTVWFGGVFEKAAPSRSHRTAAAYAAIQAMRRSGLQFSLQIRPAEARNVAYAIADCFLLKSCHLTTKDSDPAA